MGSLNEKKKKHSDGIELQTYLRNLPVCQSTNMARILTEACKVPPSTFSNWRYGLSKIPELAKDKIEEVAGVKIFTR